MREGAEGLAPISEAEEGIVQRLKLMRHTSAVSPPIRRTHRRLQNASCLAPAVIDSQWPAVPGYEIIGMLGQGGMAVVFKARHGALQRIVALKMLKNWARAAKRSLLAFVQRLM